METTEIFGALEFRRLLKRLILSGGHKIPIPRSAPVALADADLPQEPVFSEPLLSKEVTG